MTMRKTQSKRINLPRPTTHLVKNLSRCLKVNEEVEEATEETIGAVSTNEEIEAVEEATAEDKGAEVGVSGTEAETEKRAA